MFLNITWYRLVATKVVGRSPGALARDFHGIWSVQVSDVENDNLRSYLVYLPAMNLFLKLNFAAP